MTTENTTTTSSEPKKVKTKGPIRFEAIIPVAILSGLTFGYFSLYFDLHMKKGIEYVATMANGAEVNVGSVRTSFLRGDFNLNQLQVTNVERPSHNSIEIENIHFKYLWDALLRMKFVVEDASINNIQIQSPRKSPGFVIPPEPKSPSKIDELKNEIVAQVKDKYKASVLGDVLSVLEGEDFEAQIQKIRESLKSEARVKAMISDVKGKEEYWNKKIKELSDTSKLKAIEVEVQNISKNKNIKDQIEGVKKLTDLLKEVNTQYKNVQTAATQLQTEVKTVAGYPAELQKVINDDIASLKGRLSIPKIDFKDMAMHLFMGEFTGYIAKARKYQSLAEQYIPEKKATDEDDVIIPPRRSEGVNFEFPKTTGYPAFWLKRAGISSTGTAESYAGNVSGELTNVSTAPKQIGKPIVLALKGDFPKTQILGAQIKIEADYTKAVSRQSALIEVQSFVVPEKMFVQDEKMKFGFTNANASSRIKAELQGDNVQMNWNSTIRKPSFVVETKNKVATEMLNNIVNNIPAITVDGKASGTFKTLDFSLTSNLGDELGNGFQREISAKINEAEAKINTFVEKKIKAPKNQLMASLNSNTKNLSDLNKLQELYKKNEDKIKEEIEKLKKGGGVENLKDKGKDLLKKIRF